MSELNKTDIRVLKSKLEKIRIAEERRVIRAEKGNPKYYTPKVKKAIMIRYARTLRAIKFLESIVR